MVNFPANCIRGIRKKDQCIEGQNIVSFSAFLPDTRTKDTRNDNGFETSINWEDNLEVIRFTLEFRAESNNLAYPHGAVKLDISHIDYINQLPSSINCLIYERDVLVDNPYHGNIVFAGGLTSAQQRMIAGSLALAASNIINLQDL